MNLLKLTTLCALFLGTTLGNASSTNVILEKQLEIDEQFLTLRNTIDIKDLPAKVSRFVEKGAMPMALESGDLNKDGFKDYVLVFERLKTEKNTSLFEERSRPLLLLISNEAGELTELKRNELIIYCSECGGMMGDPFDGVEIKGQAFKVTLNGGSRWRWEVNYTFGYSRIDRTWQLVRVKEIQLDTFDEKSATETVSTPPNHFGKIDISDFDPKKWKGVGDL